MKHPTLLLAVAAYCLAASSAGADDGPKGKTSFDCRLQQDVKIEGNKTVSGRCVLLEDSLGAKKGDVVDYYACACYQKTGVYVTFRADRKSTDCRGAEDLTTWPVTDLRAGERIPVNY